jgi:lupus La protein
LQQVRRKTALPSAKEAARAVDSRSLYVRPFPMHASLDQIVGFFQDAGVQLNAVRVRRHLRSRDFKGSVFIEASSVEEAQRVRRGRGCPSRGIAGMVLGWCEE